MKKAIIGKKLGMTQIFLPDGRLVPVTVIQAGPCKVVQKKTLEKDGYEAVQFGFEELNEKRAEKLLTRGNILSYFPETLTPGDLTLSSSFIAHMDDDLNSADAITDIFNLVRQTNTSAQEAKVSKEALQAARDKIVELTGVLGILLDLEDEIPEEITELANKRAEAKKAKDYAEADRIRDEIQAKGYTVKDVPGGFKIEKA